MPRVLDSAPHPAEPWEHTDGHRCNRSLVQTVQRGAGAGREAGSCGAHLGLAKCILLGNAAFPSLTAWLSSSQGYSKADS